MLTVPISIEQEVRCLADTAAIGKLHVAYGRALDARDFAAYGALFAADGEWVGGSFYGAIRGRTAITAFMTETFGGADARPCVHVMSNLTAEIAGDDATAWSRFTLIEPRGGDGQPAIVLAGHYDDRLVRTASGWLFARRSVVIDLPA